MTPLNALQQLIRSSYKVSDPGNAGSIPIDRNFLYCSLYPASATSGAETRILMAPPKAGLQINVGCETYGNGNIVVTVYDSATSTTGTITFTGAAQWIELASIEISPKVYAWHAVAVYGCTTTVPTATTNTTATAVTYAGLTGANGLVFPTNLADGLDIVDSNSVNFLTFVSTTATPAITISQNATVAAGKSITLAVGAGYVKINSATSGSLKFLPAAVTTSDVTVVTPSCAATTTITLPNATATLATTALAETLTNKTLTAPVITAGTTTLGKVLVGSPTTAAGSAYSDAVAVAASDVCPVVGTTGQTGYGVKLLTGVAGQKIIIIETAGFACKLYPAAGGTLSGLGTNSPVTLAASHVLECFCTAADTWTIVDHGAKLAA